MVTPVTTWQDLDRPYECSGVRVRPDDASAVASRTVAHFFEWRDRNPDAVVRHVERYTAHLEAIAAARRPRSIVGLRALGRGRRDDELRVAREVAYFVAYDLGEIPAPEVVAGIAARFRSELPRHGRLLAGVRPGLAAGEVLASLTREFPVLAEVPRLEWLGERFERLHRILPEAVVRDGGMGKAIRATAGVLTIGACDTLDDDPPTRAAHLTRIVPGAYALGAAYVIVDDTLHDGGSVPPPERAWCHDLITAGLATGTLPDAADIPDHPLAEELYELYGAVLESHPFDEYRHLYRAAAEMHLAQSRDAGLTLADSAGTSLSAMYPDIMVKAGLSRVVAGVLARRAPDERALSRCLATIFLGQLKDDLRDREEDRRNGRLTPFTFPAHQTDTDPLYDLFAYDAYAVEEIFGGDEATADALTYFGAIKLADHLSRDPRHAVDLLHRYGPADEIARFLRIASGMSSQVMESAQPMDTRLKDRSGDALRRRKQTDVDARTFVSDRLPYLNEVTERYFPEGDGTGLDRIVAYAMRAPGKRLRPALGLMLAEALGVDTAGIEPFVAACELFHTASLLFDDLPAQDGAAFRRGRPTAHTVFDEGSVQLAGISMISSGFGLLARLVEKYPAERVTEVIGYVGAVLGPERLCKGQDIDLRMGRGAEPVTGEDILKMYELKTSTSIEAALVPLMMLEGRTPAEIDLIRRYARNAGIVFQIRDDVLDITSSREILGKDVGNDVGKINVVRAFGAEEAERLAQHHLDEAIACCAALPFDTHLLEGMVSHFAKRKK